MNYKSISLVIFLSALILAESASAATPPPPPSPLSVSPDKIEEHLKTLTPAQQEKFLEDYATDLLQQSGQQARGGVLEIVKKYPDRFTDLEKRALEDYVKRGAFRHGGQRLLPSEPIQSSNKAVSLYRALYKVAILENTNLTSPQNLRDLFKKYWWDLSPQQQAIVSRVIDLESGQLKPVIFRDIDREMGLALHRANNTFLSAREKVVALNYLGREPSLSLRAPRIYERIPVDTSRQENAGLRFGRRSLPTRSTNSLLNLFSVFLGPLSQEAEIKGRTRIEERLGRNYFHYQSIINGLTGQLLDYLNGITNIPRQDLEELRGRIFICVQRTDVLGCIRQELQRALPNQTFSFRSWEQQKILDFARQITNAIKNQNALEDERERLLEIDL